MSQRRNRARTDREKAERGRGEKEGVSDRWCSGRGERRKRGRMGLWKTEAVNKKPRIESRCEE